MTALGQSRYFRNSLSMSAYAQIADMAHSALAVAMCQSRMSELFDHFIGTQQKRLWDRQPKRRGGFEIDD